MKILPEVQALQQTSPVSWHGGLRAERACWRGESVFVKTLDTTYPDLRLRFEHEGAVAGLVDHPQVVPLLAMTPTQLIFPWVEGETLRDLVERGPVAPEAALRITAGVLRGVTALHDRGITHQDLKPENVLLAGASPTAAAVRLIDFGMSHARDLPHDIHGGTRMGTPHFMAPEQFLGVRGEPRSDLYSAGVLLFDCLAGQPPYEDALGWLAGLPGDRLPLPGPAALHPLLNYAMARDPEGRPASAREMLAELAQVAARLGVDLD
ncbi:serine/threonine-protein kinase [Deinococcus hohokamensis]|uniref:Serine/threonine-protein kinase n=1 Tax=Deinococcus hohokamensis TaxID=309883 RepID=A0ABV9IBL8_9DEIO